jgi:16S rRNA (guanine(966)-N(2))-methyltransferase RsmD
MPIRVITGSAKGRKLKMVPGEETRPVMDRVKEACFNILGSGIVESRFLDLFAGTGSVGIEALSRGAADAVFVERAPLALKTIRENLEITDLGDRAEIVATDVFKYLKHGPRASFDYVYIAPPQYRELWSRALLRLDAEADFLYPDGMVIVQIDPKEYKALELKNLVFYDQREYGRTLLCFYEKPGE